LNYLSTTAIGKLCGCTRVWAFNKARDGVFDEFKLADWHGKHYRFKDSPKLRSYCRAIKEHRQMARAPRPQFRVHGVPTLQGLAMQFGLLRRQIGDYYWQRLSAEEIKAARALLKPIVTFDRQLLQLRLKKGFFNSGSQTRPA
jgi:hypothetical protein